MANNNITEFVFGGIGILALAYVAKITSDEVFRKNIQVVEARENTDIPTATYDNGSFSGLPTATPISGGNTKRKHKKNKKRKSKKRT